MDFEPINVDHAIQSVAFVYALAAPLGPGLNALQNAHNEVRRELPAQLAPQPINPVEFSYFRRDGTPI
jgi:hypothetical protein